MQKFIFVTGGVLSGLGKGTASATMGMLLKKKGYSVSVLKIDPYLNYDPGTMSPYEHGEVFVTDDGGETDLDLGHYERFINTNLTKLSSCSAGQLYMDVISKERAGEFLGSTIQIVPHITDAIQERIQKVADTSGADITIIEVGGTVGDIESEPFVEAIRQFRHNKKETDTALVHLTLIPHLKFSGESKTKPTQHAVKALQKRGVKADILLCRTDRRLEDEIYEKIALMCNVKKEDVIEGVDVDSLYDLPIDLYNRGLVDRVSKTLDLEDEKLNIDDLKELRDKYKNPKKEVEIAIVGKYVGFKDCYLSVSQALQHAGVDNETKVNIKWVDSEEIESYDAETYLKDVDGILVPGGFGKRGIEGMIEACKYARENDIPYFGICLGMQIGVIEFSRNVLGYENANSSEFADVEHRVIDMMEEQKDIEELGGTMRLGEFACKLNENSKSCELYKSLEIKERHRHRYEYNDRYRKELEENGLKVVGTNPETGLVEIVENDDHSFFIGVQFHPEFKSRMTKSHPVFYGFVKAAANR